MEHDDALLVQVANAPTEARFSWRQSVTATFDEQTATGLGDLTLTTSQGSGKFYPVGGTWSIERRWPALKAGNEIDPLPAIIRPDPPADWEISASLLPGGSDGFGSYVGVLFSDVTQSQRQIAAYIRVLIRGQCIWNMPHYNTQQQPNGWWRRPNANVMAFGRSAILSELHPGNGNVDQAKWLLGFTYATPRLEDSELRAVRLLLDIFAGNRGQIVAEEGFDESGRVIYRQRYTRAKYSKGRGLILAPEAYEVPLFDAFNRLAGRIHEVMFVKQPPVQLDSVQHQLFTADETSYPEVALAHLGIALDGLIAMAVAQHGEFEHRAMDKQMFKDRLQPVYDTIKAQYAEFPVAERALTNRVKNANDRSVERSREIFWKEILRWTPSNAQEKLFKLRHKAVHLAHIPDARLPGGLAEVERKSLEFRNLLAGAYLRYLGFAGKIRDSARLGETITIPDVTVQAALADPLNEQS